MEPTVFLTGWYLCTKVNSDTTMKAAILKKVNFFIMIPIINDISYYQYPALLPVTTDSKGRAMWPRHSSGC
jgi:hypothetical protein